MSDKGRSLVAQIIGVMAFAFVGNVAVQALSWTDPAPRIAPANAIADRWIGLLWLLAFALFGAARASLLGTLPQSRRTRRALDVAILAWRRNLDHRQRLSCEFCDSGPRHGSASPAARNHSVESRKSANCA